MYKLKSETEDEVTQSCLTLCDPVDCSLPCSSVHEIFQARVLEWSAIAFYTFIEILFCSLGTVDYGGVTNTVESLSPGSSQTSRITGSRVE